MNVNTVNYYYIKKKKATKKTLCICKLFIATMGATGPHSGDCSAGARGGEAKGMRLWGAGSCGERRPRRRSCRQPSGKRRLRQPRASRRAGSASTLLRKEASKAASEEIRSGTKSLHNIHTLFMNLYVYRLSIHTLPI